MSLHVLSAWHAPAARHMRVAHGGGACARRPPRRARLVKRRSHALANATPRTWPLALATHAAYRIGGRLGPR